MGTMLLCVCSVADHKWCQNVVRTKKGVHKAISKCATDVPDATGNKRETNMSLTSPQKLIEEKRLPQKPKELRKLK